MHSNTFAVRTSYASPMLSAYARSPQLRRGRSSLPRSTTGLRSFGGENGKLDRPRSSVDDRATGTIEDQMQELAAFLKEDLQHLFDDQGIDPSKYESKMEFCDPITKYGSIDGYLFNIQMLRRVFSPVFTLHSVSQTGPSELTTRWTMSMGLTVNPFQALWNPELVWTGTSIMGVNPQTGKFCSHVDTWDSIHNQEYLSAEGVADLVRQLSQVYRTPDLPTPSFLILKRFKDFEVRQYEPFVVAEMEMDLSKDGDSAFNELAGYIFGKNESKTKMTMTTPVFTYGEGVEQHSMQFVIDAAEQFGATNLPRPDSSKVSLMEQKGGIFAVKKFSGVASPEMADQMSQELRIAAEQNELTCSIGYCLARYNAPNTPAFFRRNEILIEVEDFVL